MKPQRTYEEERARIGASERSWLVTGAAGFIGSHLVEQLLGLDQKVVGLDNFSTGKRENLEHVRRAVGEARWARFRFVEGDIRSLDTCNAACASVDVVLHQAGLGSVPRSIERPLRTHDSNVNGYLNMLLAARDAGVSRFVYASSSAVYGDHPSLPKVESQLGRAMSPYGLSKRINELYADVFGACYGFQSVGLRYFNVFGPRQDPDGPYASVIPAWIGALLRGETAYVNGDGSVARDFCYVDNVVQANLLAATVSEPEAVGQVYNVAVGAITNLNQLFELIRSRLAQRLPHLRTVRPVHREPRRGDMQASRADIGKAERLLGYAPAFDLGAGLTRTIEWYVAELAPVSERRLANA
jgi:UDP-N-acetylglucosamine/UDP-N-acetylgalactosamine 4-epimerase